MHLCQLTWKSFLPPIHDVPDDWNPNQRCCLHCGNEDPDLTLQAITHPATNQQALACTRHLVNVAAILDSFGDAPRSADLQAPKPTTTPASSSATAPPLRSRS